MARINESEFGETPFQRLLGHNTDVLNGWNQLGEVLEKDMNLSSHLKEQVRRTLAQRNGCEYCKAKGKPEPHLFDEKTSIAVGWTITRIMDTLKKVPYSGFLCSLDKNPFIII